jgi:4-aminobutyrate aminotransferase-like enzyme/Ser/Thr protein kinase RdoA (MazF antagonist)
MTLAVQKAPRFTNEDAVRLARAHYGLEVMADPLPSERDQNFHLRDAAGQQFVLKIANSEETPEVLDLQNKALTFLGDHDNGLEWPQVTGDQQTCIADNGTTHFVRLLSWVDGVPFASVHPHRPELLSSLGRALARIDASLGKFSHPAAHRVLHWDLRQAAMATPHLGLLTNSQRSIVEPILDSWALLDWGALRHGIIHGDANDYNILVDESGSRVRTILDFGDMVYSATVCDLAIALAYVMLGKQDPVAAAAQVIAAYYESRPLTESEIDALYTLAATRLCMSVCYSAFQAREAPENHEYLNITNGPAWTLLQQLAGMPQGWPTDVFRRACDANVSDLSERRQKHLGPSLSLSYKHPLHIVRGWMQHLYDSTGRAYLDCVNNVAHVGHCHPRVVRAAADQMALLNTNSRYLHEYLIEYIERLTATLPDRLSVVFLVCSGSEANELALRLAHAHTNRDGIIVVDTAYHGNTNALIDISPYKFNGPGGRGKPEYVQVVPMPDVYRGIHRAGTVAEAARNCNGVAAFICESALSCGGQIILPAGYLGEAYHAVRAAGGVCIADEVQTGFGRAGSHFWMFETQGVVPDIVTMGKPIGNGHPIGAVVTTPEIAASFANGMEYFNTFGGNPVSCAVGLAVLDVIRDEGLQENARDAGEYLLCGLRDLAERHSMIGDVRGLGLFLGFELVRNRETKEPAEAGELVNRMKDRGVLLSTDGPFHNVIKIKPPLIFTRADADVLLCNLDGVLA